MNTHPVTRAVFVSAAMALGAFALSGCPNVANLTTARVIEPGAFEITACDARVVTAMLAAAAFGEAAFGFCLGCRIFALLMRLGVIPETVCEDCNDLSLRLPSLAARNS